MAEKDVVPMTAEEERLVEAYLEPYTDDQRRLYGPELKQRAIATIRDPRCAGYVERLKKKLRARSGTKLTLEEEVERWRREKRRQRK